MYVLITLKKLFSLSYNREIRKMEIDKQSKSNLISLAD